jgi:hypothetical protein
MSKKLLFLLPTLIGLLAFGPAAAQNITIRGKDFYRVGKPWLAKGIKVEALLRSG